MDSDVCDLSGSVFWHPVYRANERRLKTSWRIPRITTTRVCRGYYSRNRYQTAVGKGRENSWSRVARAKWLEIVFRYEWKGGLGKQRFCCGRIIMSRLTQDTDNRLIRYLPIANVRFLLTPTPFYRWIVYRSAILRACNFHKHLIRNVLVKPFIKRDLRKISKITQVTLTNKKFLKIFYQKTEILL